MRSERGGPSTEEVADMAIADHNFIRVISSYAIYPGQEPHCDEKHGCLYVSPRQFQALREAGMGPDATLEVPIPVVRKPSGSVDWMKTLPLILTRSPRIFTDIT